jgi:pimeloyl-ACP methyl ester carboxylesterase
VLLIRNGMNGGDASDMDTLAEHFLVSAPDTRGCGRTAHTSGPITFDLLADDVAALIEALDLDRPLLTGFSDGGITSTVVGIRHPDLARAIVNHAGFDEFDPQAPTFAMMRQILGGRPDATKPDPDAAAAAMTSIDQMRPIFELMKTDQDREGSGTVVSTCGCHGNTLLTNRATFMPTSPRSPRRR